MGMTRTKNVPVLATGFLVALLATACNNSRGTGGPILKTIPAQSVGGGTTFTLDLSSYVTDVTNTATFSVLAGGGSFSGSVYSNAFKTLGTYTVSFEVRDFRNNTQRGTFQVKITSAQLAVVRGGDGLSLLDMQTQNFVSPIANDGRAKVYKGALANGSIILEVTQSGQTDLWLHDPNVAGTEVFAGDATKNETYIGKTSTNQIVFARGATPNRTIWLYDPTSRGSIAISAVFVGGGPRDEYGAMIAGNRVYFASTLATSGQSDVWYYDITTNVATAISTHAEPETLVATLPNDGIVWTRNGATSEKDLLYWNGGIVLEIGTDLSTAINLESKTYRAATSDSRVVFETTDGGGDEDLYVWNPVGPASATIAATGVDETYVATSGSGRIVYGIQTGGSNLDLSWYIPSSNTSGAIANSSDNEVYNGTLANGDVIYTRTATGDDLYHWIEATTTPTPFPGATTNGTNYVFAKILGNEDIVYTVGADIFVYTPSLTTSAGITTSTGTESFGGAGAADGDFVISLVNGGVTSLYFWDKSATTSTAMVTTGVSVYQGVAPSGLVVYSRTAPSESQSDLWSYAPSTSTTAQVTTGTTNDTVDAVISATN